MVKRSMAGILKIILPLLLIINVNVSYSQTVILPLSSGLPDSIVITKIVDSTLLQGVNRIDFDLKQATAFIDRWYRSTRMWNDRNDPLRKAMGRLLFEATNDPLYNSEIYLREFDWEQIKISTDNFFLWDTLHIKVTGESDSVKRELPIAIRADSLVSADAIARADTSNLPELYRTDSLLSLDTLIYSERERPADNYRIIDSIVLVVRDTLSEVISTDADFPFRYYNYPLTGDSIAAAIDILLAEVVMKDTTRVVFLGQRNEAPLLLSNVSTETVRLWLENEWGEGVSIWLKGAQRDTIEVAVEDGVHFRRLNKETNIANVQIGIREIDSKTLSDVKKLDFKQNYWKFLSEAAFTFNQAMLKNWSKGGESNIAFTTDIQGIIDYTDKQRDLSWNTLIRFKYGYMASGAIGNKDDFSVRKNVDQIDISSKYNTKAFGRFNFSGTMIFKTQLAKGYAYPNDSVIVSKFFNPATLTLGFGLEYKPNKNTSINFAPLAYKGTYVPDTAMIDQTKHGLLADQRAKHEPGISAQIDHKMTIFKDITVVNKVRLFTNYIHNPQNIDIEWEMTATAKLNWFTDVRLNTHFIYDDDTLIPQFNDDGSKLLGSDGLQKKYPKVQFKEIIGISIIFRF